VDDIVNLLDHFYLQHVRITRLNAELTDAREGVVDREAKVELNLAPRPLKADSGDELPGYRVNARLSCRSGEQGTGPKFEAVVGVEAIYRQMDGDPVDVATFGAHHASLTRQLYPMLQQELRGLMLRLGLERIHLPFDLPARVEHGGAAAVEVSGSVH
jgi:hypothetical protein